MSTLERALEIARAVHTGQADKAGRPYMEHVLRVVDAVEGEDAKIVAALHGVLEDGAFSVDQLAAHGSFSPDTMRDVDVLTRWAYMPSYPAYIARIASGSPLARAVKIADLRDNSDPARLATLPERDRERLSRKYAAALKQLDSAHASY